MALNLIPKYKQATGKGSAMAGVEAKPWGSNIASHDGGKNERLTCADPA